MSFEKRFSPVVIVACLLATVLLVACCGDSNTPQATVEEIVRAVRTGATNTVLYLFENKGSLYFFEEALPDTATPAVGEVTMNAEDSATVVVLLTPMRPDEGGFTFVMKKSGDSWRVTQVLIKEGSG